MHQPHPDFDPELAGALQAVLGPGERFGHRQHIHLTFLAVHRYGMPAAIGKVSGWIRQIAAHHGAPQKYHDTVTRAWVELVAHHVETDPQCTEFTAFAQRHSRLLDKQLLTVHYRPSTLTTKGAREDWIEPDLAPFPWRARAPRFG